MELSKKVGYIKGLMAGLDINDSTPEGKVLLAMSDLLEEMADEIETNAEIIDNISLYIDEIEAYDDLLDDLEDDDDFEDIEAEEFDHDPFFDVDPFEDLSMAEVTGEDEADDPMGLQDITELEMLDGLDDESDGDEQEAEEENAPEQQEAAAETDSFECLCPECGTAFAITAEDISRGTVYCPNCAVQLKFES